MRWSAVTIAAFLGAFAWSGGAAAETVHTVYPGQTFGRIAKRYNVSIEALCAANNMSRRDRLKPGQKLVIPEPGTVPAAHITEPSGDSEAAEPEVVRRPSDGNASEGEAAKSEPARPRLPGGMQVVDLPGTGPAYFFEPSGPGRRSMRPVLVYLHGRGGHPADDCRRWAPVARRIGWLVCPSGPGALGDGRGWNNNWVTAQQAAMNAVKALRDRYGRRVQLWGNTLIGFSEGAYAAMNVGVREPRTFNRWLILAADAKYWGGPGLTALHDNRGSVRRVYLITGEQDEVVEGTRTTQDWLEKIGINTHVTIPKGVGHEVALQRKPGLYRAALMWLEKGSGKEDKEKDGDKDDTVAKNEQ